MKERRKRSLRRGIKRQRYSILGALTVLTVVLVSALGYFIFVDNIPFLVRFELLNAATSRAVSDTPVALISDARTWRTTTDKKGIFYVWSWRAKAVFSLAADGYEAINPADGRDVVRITAGHWLVELDPSAIIKNGQRRLKIFSARDLNVVVLTPVWITNASDCGRISCIALQGFTSNLGNVYIPNSFEKRGFWLKIPDHKPVALPLNQTKNRLLLESI